MIWRLALIARFIIHIDHQYAGDDIMPTLFRFLFLCATVAAMIYGSMWALVIFVEPTPRDVTVKIPAERLNPPAPSQ